MPNYDNEIALWKNEKREKETDPHYTGTATVGGVKYRAVAWGRKKDANPEAPLIKVKLNVIERRDEPAPQQGAPDGDIDDNIPF